MTDDVCRFQGACVSSTYFLEIAEELQRQRDAAWNAALDAVLVHCEEVREDRRTHPPTFKDGRRKVTPEDIVLVERATVGSIKCRIESLRRTQGKDATV